MSSSAETPALSFTGERLVPGKVDADLYQEHLARYVFAEPLAKGRRVLDAGCGVGYGAQRLARCAQHVEAVDNSPEAIAYARAQYRSANLVYAVADVTALPFPAGAFDLAVAFELIEHLTDPRLFLRELARVLRPDGLALISTPNRTTYSDARPGYVNPFHIREYYAEEFLALLRETFPAVRLLQQNYSQVQMFADASNAGESRLVCEAAPQVGNDDAQFFLAVCGFVESDVAAASFNRPVLLTGSGNVLTERRRWIEILQREVATRDAALQSLRAEFAERTAWAKRSAEEVSVRNAAILRLQKNIEERCESAVSLSERAEQESARRAAAEGELKARNAAVGEIEERLHALANAAAECDKLTNDLREREETIEQMEKNIHEFEKAAGETAELRRALEQQSHEIGALAHLLNVVVGASASALEKTDPELKKRLDYCQLTYRIRGVVRETVPADAIVLVISKGDDDLLALGGRTGWHFPRDAAGAYPGYAPASSAAAIVQLEAQRSNEAGFLVIPQTAFWWLDHYLEFKTHLERQYRRVLQREDACIIFDLRHVVGAADGDALGQIREIVSECERRLRREPSIMDWNSGLDLANAMPERALFSPATEGSRLPYLEQSVDIVVLASSDPEAVAEAERIATGAVVAIRHEGGRPIQELKWKPGLEAGDLPSASIVVPTFNGLAHLKRCLRALRETLPRGAEVEIIVVDDASTDGTAAFLHLWAVDEPRLKVVRNKKNSGFILSCNRGAREARGEVLVFLNDDTVPLPEWLPPLLRILQDDAAVGAVGGKLIYPDGTLQEAGGVIFADGSGANFGRNSSDLDAPLFNYVREVDYCSGALLATRRSVFLEVGGFDLNLAPAYYEDTDYCFRLREKGFRVVFQPESAVIHFEGASSGTDVTKGIKRYQIVNLAKFKARWGDVLKSQPAPLDHYDSSAWHALAVRDIPRGSSKRAVFFSPVMPQFDREGGSRRIFHLIEFLRADGWQISFVAQRGADGARYKRLLQQSGIATYIGFSAETDLLISATGFDLAILVFWDIAEQHLAFLRSASARTRVIVDSIDLHFLRNARRIFSAARDTGMPQMLGASYGAEMAREMNVYAAADGVLAVSEKEAALIDDLTGETGLADVVKLAEDFPLSPVPRSKRRGILFLANFRHTPNIDALEFLCRDILPHIDEAILSSHPLLVVGNGVDDVVRKIVAGIANVRIVGWVPFVQPYLERASISVIPLLYGAGTKTKLIQSLMSGTPAVSTTIGTEGLGLTHGEEVLVADDAPTFAQAIVQLLKDKKLWERLSQKGRAHIEPRHGFEAVKKQVITTVRSVLGRKPKSGKLTQTDRDHQWRISQHYAQHTEAVCEAALRTIPPDATVLVISKGDESLVTLPGRQAWHFPRTETGVYAGYYPRDSAAAIEHLEALRAQGAGYLLLPRTAFWWLDHYEEFRQHLETRYHLLFRADGVCAIYDILPASTPEVPPVES